MAESGAKVYAAGENGDGGGESGPAGESKPIKRMQSGIGGNYLKAEVFDEGNVRMDWMAYKFDGWIQYRKNQFIAIVIGLLLQVIGGGLIYSLFLPADTEDRFFEGMWVSWTYMADPGTHADAGGEEPTKTGLWTTRLAAFIVAAVGIIYMSAILGLIVEIIDTKLEALKKGKSKVMETEHTLMLGWTDKSISFIKEIALANESENGGVIVVLSEQDKQEMELDLKIAMKPKDLLGTSVVFRKGSPLLTTDLIKVRAHEARAILIMAKPGDPEASDADVLRTVLSLMGMSHLKCHVVAEMRDVDNEPLVRIVGGDNVETIVSHDILGRLMLMSARQPGLAKVYSTILGFDDDEFYMQEWPELNGVRFGDLQERFPDAIPLGIKEPSGIVTLKPAFGHIMREGEELLVIAEDDDTYKPCEPAPIGNKECESWREQPKEPEKILFCGWRRDIRDVIMLLNDVVAPGSEVHMMNEVPLHQRDKKFKADGLDTNLLQNITIKHWFGNTAVRRHLLELPIETFSSAMILADVMHEADIMKSDSHSLATLLLIRDIQRMKRMSLKVEALKSANVISNLDRWKKKIKKKDVCAIICEILDSRTQKTIAGNTKMTESLSSDFVQSNELVSQVLAMVCENQKVKAILDELMAADGCSLGLTRSVKFVNPTEELDFYTLAKRCHSLGEILIGYQHAESMETVVNPRDKSTAKTWGDYELIILEGNARTDMDEDKKRNVVNSIFKNQIKAKDVKSDIASVQTADHTASFKLRSGEALESLEKKDGDAAAAVGGAIPAPFNSLIDAERRASRVVQPGALAALGGNGGSSTPGMSLTTKLTSCLNYLDGDDREKITDVLEAVLDMVRESG